MNEAIGAVLYLFRLHGALTNRVCILLKGFGNELRLGTVHIEQKVNNICQNENGLVYATVYQSVTETANFILSWVNDGR